MEKTFNINLTLKINDNNLNVLPGEENEAEVELLVQQALEEFKIFNLVDDVRAREVY